jgi:hypothetical protein
MKKVLTIVFFSLLLTGNVFAEKYSLICKVNLFDLEGTSWTDKTRFNGTVLNFNIDTENKISSNDMNDEKNPDKIILHGLWPDAELLEPSFGEEIYWENQLLISDGKSPSIFTSGDPWTLYRYVSNVKKKTDKEKDNQRILKITILEYVKKLTVEDIINEEPSGLTKALNDPDFNIDDFMEEVEKEITGENDKKIMFDPKQSTKNVKKTLKNTFKFEFKCTK